MGDECAVRRGAAYAARSRRTLPPPWSGCISNSRGVSDPPGRAWGDGPLAEWGSLTPRLFDFPGEHERQETPLDQGVAGLKIGPQPIETKMRAPLDDRCRRASSGTWHVGAAAAEAVEDTACDLRP